MKKLDAFNSLLLLSFHQKLSMLRRVGVLIDVFLERVKYGTEIQDYFQYEFYNLKNRERRNYMTAAKLRYTMKICNNVDKRKLFDDKTLFNKTFSKYIFREWLDVNSSNLEEFTDFISRHPVFFAKARFGMFGKNAGRYDVESDNIETIKQLFEQLARNNCIIEQNITQHATLKKFNETSVNTLRIVTVLCADGVPKVMTGVLRIGRKGQSADNFHHYGIAATIDVENGIVDSWGIDRNFARYTVHPDSGEQIIGFKVPSWNKACELVKEAAMIIQDVRYIGWDVAVDKDGNVQLIEGNFGADPDVTQMPIRRGIWPLFKPLLDEIAKNSD